MLKAGTYISVLMRQLNLFFGHELSDVEITASELMYLSQLYSRDGLTQEEMAAVITVDKAAKDIKTKNMVPQIRPPNIC